MNRNKRNIFDIGLVFFKEKREKKNEIFDPCWGIIMYTRSTNKYYVCICVGVFFCVVISFKRIKGRKPYSQTKKEKVNQYKKEK